MTLRATLLAATIGTAFLFTQAHAGGPVVIEEPEDIVAPQPKRNLLPWIIGAGVVIAIIASSGSDSCFTEEPTPGPSPVC
jgi:hypothetical protein